MLLRQRSCDCKKLMAAALDVILNATHVILNGVKDRLQLARTSVERSNVQSPILHSVQDDVQNVRTLT